jgi:hypothetical protein
MAEAEKTRGAGKSRRNSTKSAAKRQNPSESAGRIETVYKPLDWFKPHPRNARTHSKKQIRKLAQLLREFGFVGHIVAKGDGTIIAGHGRHEAARFNDANGDPGFKELPTIIVDGWSDQKIRAFILADNRIAEDAGWDDELLKIELSELSASDFDVALTGFDEKEIGRLIADEIDGANFGAGEDEGEGDQVVCTCPGCGHEFKASFVAVEKKSKRKSAKSTSKSGGDHDDGHRDPAEPSD